uniref:Embryonic flower 1 n=1 Tax=Dimocarpus longan TaxID=128017 RepID=A0A059V8Y0_9ROSI|nr:embryonic flower 1 [Dimocarpus longan]
MEKSLVVLENHQTGDSDLVSKSAGSSIKIDSISIDLVSNDETDARECEHFSIRGYVSEIRKKNWKLCWPFASSDGNHDKSGEQTCPLPPLQVSKSRWWRCQNCLQELGGESTPNNHGNAFSYRNTARLKSSGTCSHVSSPGDATLLQPDFQQAKLNTPEGGKVDASTAIIDLNDDECLPSSSTGKKDKNFESAKKPITGLEIGSEDNLNQEVLVSGAATGVVSGPVMGRDDTVSLKRNCNGSVESCKPVCGSNGNAEFEVAKKIVNCVLEDSAGVCQTGKQPSAENHHSEVMLPCKTSNVVSMVGEVLGAVQSYTSEFPSADECITASPESDEMLTGNDLQDHMHDNSNGLHRKKTRKVRLLTELLADNGDASTKPTRSEKFPTNSVPEASAGVDELSAPQGMVTVKGNAGLDQTKKRKLPRDEERAPLDISSPNNLFKKDGISNEGAESTGTFACSGSEEDGRLSLQLGKRSHLNKVIFDTIPTTGKKKNKTTLVVDDECMSLTSSQENVPKDIQGKAGDADNPCAADTVLLKPGQTTFTSRGIYPFPLPPQKMEESSSVCKKKSKIDQFNGGQVSLNPWSSCVLRESPVTRKDVEMLQMPSLPAPFLSAQNASNEKGLHHSLGSCLPTHAYDGNYISSLEDRLIWRGSTSKENQVLGRDILSNHVGDSSFPTKSEPTAHLQKGVRCDLRTNTYTSVLNEKLKSPHHIGNSSLMQQMDFSGTGDKGKSTERLEHSALAKKHSDQQADKLPEQGVPDDIPMEIVELMAKNQYERCLPDVENEKQPLETTINTSGAQIYAKGKLSFVPQKTAHKPKPRVKNSRNDMITRVENVGATKQKSVDCVSHFDRNHLNFGQLGPAYAPTGLRFIPQFQEKVQSGVKFSATSSSTHDSSQNCQWIGSIMGHRSSQTNAQTLESCNSCLSVPRQGKEAASTWSSMIQNHMPFAYNNPQKHVGPSTSTDMFSHCTSNLRKGNLNGNRELNFLNLNVANHPEKHYRNIDSQILSKNMENPPFTCKHSGLGSLDLYSNETISAMHLLSLMDAGLSSSQPIEIDGTPKFQKRPSFPHDRHARDFSIFSSGGYKTSSTMKPSSYDYYGKNHLSENSRGCSPAISNVDASGFPFQCNKGAKKPTDLIGQSSLKFQEREKAKGSASTSQNKGHKSNKSVLTIGGSGINHGSVPVHSMPKMFLGDSDSMVLPLQRHVMENAPKHKLEALDNPSTNWPLKSSSKTEICSVNRNPADFSVPEARNVYMIRGEDLKCRLPLSSGNRSGVDKLDRQKHKRQKKVTAAKGKV